MLSLQQLIRLKKIDFYIQIVAAVAAFGLAYFTMLFSFFILGATHALSTLFWLAIGRGFTLMKGRNILTIANVMAILATLVAAIFEYYFKDGFWPYVIGISFVGPVLGISYFVLTIKEIRFYKSLQQSEDLNLSRVGIV